MSKQQLILLFLIICCVLYLYFNIVPCKNNNVNNNVTETFESSDISNAIKQILDTRLDLLKEQTIKKNDLSKKIATCLNDIETCKNKINKLMAESNNANNQVYSTNGEIIEVEQ